MQGVLPANLIPPPLLSSRLCCWCYLWLCDHDMFFSSPTHQSRALRSQRSALALPSWCSTSMYSLSRFLSLPHSQLSHSGSSWVSLSLGFLMRSFQKVGFKFAHCDSSPTLHFVLSLRACVLDVSTSWCVIDFNKVRLIFFLLYFVFSSQASGIPLLRCLTCFRLSYCWLYFKFLLIALPGDHLVGSFTCDFPLCLVYLRLVSLHPICHIRSLTCGPDIWPAFPSLSVLLVEHGPIFHDGSVVHHPS